MRRATAGGTTVRGGLSVSLDPSLIRQGRVNGRYFRENFAQGGIDLVQIIPELVTNADSAIAVAGRPRGRIVLRFGAPDAGFATEWRRAMRRLRAPALTDWRHELRCTDDGVGMDAAGVDRRLGALGVTPDASGQRGLFGRGLRDVWLAQGGGRIESVHAGRLVESWFFPSSGDDPYGYAHVREQEATAAARAELGLGLAKSGTRITVPLAAGAPPANARLRRLVGQLVQLRPVLGDPAREVWLELPGEPAQLVTLPVPEPDPERPLLADEEIELAAGLRARVVVRRAAEPIPLSPSRATRLGGLVILSGRAAHETTLAGHEGEPGTRHLYGEVICEALEELQRAALESPRPQVVVKVDRSGLNEHHPVVQQLYAGIERVLRPIVAAEERRAGAHIVRAGRAVQARDQVGLRALNDALRGAFDAPGTAGFERGGAPSTAPAQAGPEPGEREPGAPAGPAAAPDEALAGAMRFKQSPIRLHPGEDRGVSLVIDPAQVPPGTPVSVSSDPGLRLKLWADAVPEPNRGGWSRLTGSLRARVSVEPGARLTVIAEAAGHSAELEVLIVRHRASGWVSGIARKDEDALIEAHFDPESGIVTVYEGRPEFKALERAARRAGYKAARVREYLPYRMLEVEVAANAVYHWAAERIVARRLAGELRNDPVEYAHALRHEAQALRHRAHEKLMRAFLDPEVFTGGVQVVEDEPAEAQTRLGV